MYLLKCMSWLWFHSLFLQRPGRHQEGVHLETVRLPVIKTGHTYTFNSSAGQLVLVKMTDDF